MSEEWGDAEIQRDHWGRPLIIPIDGDGRKIAYTRCTTFVGCMEDTYNLGRWQQRAVAYGLSARPDLLLKVNSLGPEPGDQGAVKRWKNEMDQTCEAAMEAAKANASATIGTALHALTERLDRGQDVGVVPEAYKPHLAAYQAATAGFTALHIEQFTVLDQLKIGGTPDRVIKIDGMPGAYIADLKTGSVEYGLGKMAMQLAVYSRSQLYDPSSGARAAYAEEIDQDRGLIIGLSAKTGRCEMFWVDLVAGWHGVQLAAQVRAWRARKDLDTPYVPPIDLATGEVKIPNGDHEWPIPVADQITANAAAALLTAIEHARTADELVELWRAAGDRWTDHHTDRAQLRKAELTAAVLT